MKKITLLLLLSIGVGQAARAQANRDTADARYKAAIAMMENGKPAAAIPLLEEAIQLNPDEWSYYYEMAYSKYMQQEYGAVIDITQKLTKRKDINSRVYQLLGNAYDMKGKREKAMEAYDNGLKVFPDAGNLYLERGVMEISAKDNKKALEFFEKGIDVDPTFPSNYYWATKLYLNTDEEAWGMLLGEIFLNLERGSKRTDEISKLLYLTYKSEIRFKDDTSVTVSFFRERTIAEIASSHIKNRIPNEVSSYDFVMSTAVGKEKIINLSSLNRIRTRFLEMWYGRFVSPLPMALFDYQLQVKEAGFLEEYNYWILAEGDEKQFEEWKGEHQREWEEFIQWFKSNPMKITKENRFSRWK